MAIARHATGFRADLRALGSQVHPVFMLPPLAASWFGAIVAGEFGLGVGAVHMAAMFCAVYTAHVKDGYVDFYGRGEDDDHPLTSQGCRIALAGATVGFVCCVLALGVVVDATAALITLPTWFIGFLHAPQLDTNPVTTTLGYPTGIALAIVGGHYVQATAVSATALGFALVFLVTLAGVKIIDDEQDYDYDRSISKATVAVVLGRTRARRLAFSLFMFGLIGVLWGTLSGLFPPSSPLGALAFGAVAVAASRGGPTVGTMLLIRGAYVFLALLVVAVWFEPFSAVALPDITALGSYTYLATEIAFGSLALALLVYAGALGRAARTLLAVYPIAYVWDWYTLEVGVFDITMRTGYDLFGIPIEEHIFMLVVPGLVIGMHEAIQTLAGDQRANGTADGAVDGRDHRNSHDHEKRPEPERAADSAPDGAKGQPRD
ncbi:lycopene cyclase [Halovenus salina]|uniref:lycopene cyclase n=1 Tax=Halovenus salina TaxID=1510225 RepID=UPI0034A22AAA